MVPNLIRYVIISFFKDMMVEGSSGITQADYCFYLQGVEFKNKWLSGIHFNHVVFLVILPILAAGGRVNGLLVNN